MVAEIITKHYRQESSATGNDLGILLLVNCDEVSTLGNIVSFLPSAFQLIT
jgi:hypothetical protein